MQSFSKIGHTFYKGLMFFDFVCNIPNVQKGDPYKKSNINVVQSCWNCTVKENKQVAKIWKLQLKKQKIGATMCFPAEGLEDTPYTSNCPSS